VDRSDPLETCWTVVGRAANGETEAYSVFVHSYLGCVRAFLAKRWRGTPAVQYVDDAVQEVFLDLLRADGALSRFDPERGLSFRSFLFGVVHKVALRHEERTGRDLRRQAAGGPEPDEIPNSDPTMSRLFDREWATCLIQRARERLERQAEDAGAAAQRRVELLRLRFVDGMPIREIAALWEVDAARVHKEYAKAREEFKAALRAEVTFHNPGTAAEVDRECQHLLELLQ
jgi:RNA polymerase sigma factor (sigma-70 family)